MYSPLTTALPIERHGANLAGSGVNSGWQRPTLEQRPPPFLPPSLPPSLLPLLLALLRVVEVDDGGGGSGWQGGCEEGSDILASWLIFRRLLVEIRGFVPGSRGPFRAPQSLR